MLVFGANSLSTNEDQRGGQQMKQQLILMDVHCI